MGIETFIRDNILNLRLRDTHQLQKAECLVVYDPELRYRNICLSMATDKVVVVDAGERVSKVANKLNEHFKN